MSFISFYISGRYYHYRIAVGPAVNFMTSAPTSIEHNEKDFFFEGFSIFSEQPLKDVGFTNLLLNSGL